MSTPTNISKGFWADILTDSNSCRYSMTKVGSFIGIIMMFIVIITSTYIMIDKHEIDHTLIVEIIGFTLTAIGYKNGFGFNIGNRINSIDSEAINGNINDDDNNTKTSTETSIGDDMPQANSKIEDS